MILIVMGVSGIGKTTIGKKLADDLNLEFIEADDFHNEFSVRKMSQGIALHDEDRLPWLDRLRHQMEKKTAKGQDLIVACSALKNSYRNRLRQDNKQIFFVYLRGDFDLVFQRIQRRKGHFMKTELLSSQFETLEEPEDVFVVDASLHEDQIIHNIREKFFPTGKVAGND